MSKQIVIMMVGLPASGKSTSSVFQDYIASGEPVIKLCRDVEGGKTLSLLPKMEENLKKGVSVILDCTFMQSEKRKHFIDLAAKYNVPIDCVWMTTSAEDCQINALNRMMERYGKVFLDANALKGMKDPNMFPIAVLFTMKKALEKPDVSEGFRNVHKIKFQRRKSEFKNKAIFLDYDGTLRSLPDSAEYKYPVKPSEVIVRQNASRILQRYIDEGYILLGVSNQSGIGKGHLTDAEARACFDETNKQLGLDIEYSYCPHRVPPVSCYCRKPQAGMAIPYAWKHKLDLSQCIMVGDMTSDKTFATRLGMEFIHADEFFKEDQRFLDGVEDIDMEHVGKLVYCYCRQEEEEPPFVSFAFDRGDGEMRDAYYDSSADEQEYLGLILREVGGLSEAMENAYDIYKDEGEVLGGLKSFNVERVEPWFSYVH